MTVLPSCANCGAALSGPFCSNCGQRASDLHRPIWWILGEFLDSVFGYDSRTFRTLWLLFAEPGEFTKRYIVGQRASLLPPFRLFVIATIVFFLTLQITGLSIVAFKMETISLEALPPEAVAQIKNQRKNSLVVENDKTISVVTMDFLVPAEAVTPVKLTEQQKRQVIGAGEAMKIETKNADAEELGWLRWIQARVERVTQGYERALADPIKLNGPLNVWLPRLMLVLVPVFALLVAVMHWWPRVFMIEHLVFSLHIHTVIFVALSLSAAAAALIGDSEFMWAVWLILTLYLWMAMYRVYGRSWWLTTIKFAALMFVYSLVLTAGLTTIFVIALSEI
jgi:Protein of unknown function (DUF3667)